MHTEPLPGETRMPGPVRPPAVAGYFYPGDRATLLADVEKLLSPARPADGQAPAPSPKMLMVPHAGYIYSGAVAGKTLSAASLPQIIFLLGPSHSGKGERLAVWPGGSWQTPLGAVPVDEEAAQALTDSHTGYRPDTQAHIADHALEVLLPLLQVAVPGLRIVPVTVAWHDFDVLNAAGKALADAMDHLDAAGKPSSIVVSSDMSHFLSQEDAMVADSTALGELLALDPKGLYETVLSQRISMCGILPATLGLVAARERGASQAEQVAYATSGDVSGDMGRVVGYAGVLIT